MHKDSCRSVENSAISSFPFDNMLPSPRLSRNLCIFSQKARSIVAHYRVIRAFSARKPDHLSVIMSLTPLFSYTSPEVPSFLTSLWISAPFRTLKSTFVSRHNWPRLESSILCINGAFRSQESAYCFAYCLLLSAYCSMGCADALYRSRPCKSASGYWPQCLVYMRLLALSRIK